MYVTLSVMEINLEGETTEKLILTRTFSSIALCPYKYWMSQLTIVDIFYIITSIN